MELGLKSGNSAGFGNAFLIRTSGVSLAFESGFVRISSCISSWDIKFGFGLFFC